MVVSESHPCISSCSEVVCTAMADFLAVLVQVSIKMWNTPAVPFALPPPLAAIYKAGVCWEITANPFPFPFYFSLVEPAAPHPRTGLSFASDLPSTAIGLPWIQITNLSNLLLLYNLWFRGGGGEAAVARGQGECRVEMKIFRCWSALE